MTRAWSKSDEPDRRQAREIVRNCGQVLGRLDDVLPFLYVAQFGASGRAMRERTTEAAAGLIRRRRTHSWRSPRNRAACGSNASFAAVQRREGTHSVAENLALIDGMPYCADIRFDLYPTGAEAFAKELMAWCAKPEYAFGWKGD